MSDEAHKSAKPSGRIHKWSRRRRLIAFIILGVGLVVVFASISAALLVNRANNRADQLVSHSITLITEALVFQASVQGAVIGERAYLLTGEDEYLTDYEHATQAHSRSLERLRELTREIPIQQLRLDDLQTISENISATLARTIRRAQTENLQVGADTIPQNQVDQNLAEFNDLVVRFIDEERRRLRERRQEQLGSDRLSSQIILGSMVIIAGLLLLQVLITREQNLLHLAKNLQMMETNAELESRVAERTKELEAAKNSLEEENIRVESLLRDLHHRVGNSLQLVASFLGLQANQVDGEEARVTLQAARERVLSIAATQRRLRFASDHETVNANRFIGTIVEDLRANLTFEQEIEIETDIGEVIIPSRDAVTIGVLLAELVTNAVKYAFRGHETGVIRISLKEDDSGEYFNLSVEDDGVGFDAGARDPHGGLGTRIIDRLVMALGGELQRAPAQDGAPPNGRPGARVDVQFPNPGV
ncbi:sensor histidine kinase [Hyphococcus sp.]|uniref:sensor histidine kinase n=1 Tax=Hyphococcus sp. TaxID=2038636 RepID=UPI003CCBC5E7